MKSIADLNDFINANDVYSFLLTYLEILNTYGSLEIPLELNMESLAHQWKDVLPAVCQNASEDFYQQLALLWFELVTTYQETTTDKSFDFKHLIEILHRRQLENKKFEIFAISQGYVLSDFNNKAVSVYDISYDFSEQNLIAALKQNNAVIFLIEFFKEALVNTAIKLPKSSVEDVLKAKFSVILNSNYNKNKSLFLNKVVKVYLILVNRFGLPVSQDKIKKSIHYLVTTKINL
jgi:hypothetical protein